MSLIDLRQLKKTKTSNVNTSIVQSDDENAGDLSYNLTILKNLGTLEMTPMTLT